ncbi:MAG: AraC family transcriptional regulator [Faecalibacterium sp.]|jgi:AraC-like DNA-binding protein/mannose-6-phosphate isomerase-like protein (cupin superfamily)|nr:AraC family transcriptional regulator [Faecalibacterium sp.]
MSSERFDVKFSPAPREAVRLLYISKSRYGGDWHSMLHTHSCTEVFYCLSGAGQFNIAGHLHAVSPDDMVIVNPQVEHTELSLNANPLEYVVLGIEGIEFLFSGPEDTYAMLNCRTERERVLFVLRALLQEISLDADGCEVVCQDLLEVLLLWLVRSNSFTVRPCSAPIRSGSKECAAVKRYLEENFKENITLEQLAGVAHINKYYLSHAFQQEYGVSPIAYLGRQRISESKYLLENTNHSLSQIGEMLGFSSLSYFSQCFHKAEGISPNEYRRQVRAGQRKGVGTKERGKLG